MKITHIIGLSFIVLLLLNACNEKESGTYMTILPNSYIIEAQANNIIRFKVTGKSDETIQRFTMRYQTDNEFETVLVDSAINASGFYIMYELKVPEYLQNNVQATIYFESIAGAKVVSTYRKLYITSERKLEEVAGNVLYSSLSGEQNGYNLINTLPLYAALSDSSEIHIADASVDSIHGDNISRQWNSPAGISFVRYNDFDYANATINDLYPSFQSGIKREFISNLTDNDIILVSYPVSHALKTLEYAAIRINQVIDDEGTLNDRYLFSIKK